MQESSNPPNSLLRRWLLVLVLLSLFPITITAPYVLLEPEQPDVVVPFPEDLAPQSDGYLLVVLDGVGENIMRDSTMMPKLVDRLDEQAVLSVTTGPLTLSATCVREMMTGVPNAPIDGLKNFNMGHPGGFGPWLLAAASEQHSVGMIGSYVMGNMYGDSPNIEFINTFEGHADYYEGDRATGAILEEWLVDGRHNVIAAHFSGPDKVGHKWGTVSEEYRNKMLDMDQHLSSLLRFVPANWTVVVTADHGMTASGSHGSAEADTRNVLALVSGPEIDASARADAAQLDLAALMLYDLGLDFPSQVHGRVPLPLLSISLDDRDKVEAWNWEAALHRHVFFHPEDTEIYRVVEINWQGIEGDPVSIRPLDVFISIAVLSATFLLAYKWLQQGQSTSKKEQQHLLLLGGIVVASVWFHSHLSFSAMIPRAIGAGGVVWLVASSLGRTPPLALKGTSNFFKPFPWLLGLLMLTLFFFDLSRGLLVLLVAWVVFWSVGAMTGQAKQYAPSSKTVHLLAVLVSLLLGSLRLWYALLPMFLLVTGLALEKTAQSRPRHERVSVWAIWCLLVLSLSYVHRRILGDHHLLKLVNLAPSNVFSALVLAVMLILFSVFFGLVSQRQYGRAHAIWCFVFLVSAFTLSRIEWLWVQQIVLLGILALYFGAGLATNLDLSSRKLLLHAGLALHMMVSWGPWATVAGLTLLLSLPAMVEGLRIPKRQPMNWREQPQAMLAWMVLPWVVWILWWTLMGQVNGVQFCYEGICPHPRELDPGLVKVQGGYFGGGAQPSTIWMTIMVVSPLLMMSVALMHQFMVEGLDLRPYVVSQGLIVFGCLALYAYTPIYPRLVFSLTYNMLFASAQMCFALLAMGWFRITHETEGVRGMFGVNFQLGDRKFRDYETI